MRFKQDDHIVWLVIPFRLSDKFGLGALVQESPLHAHGVGKAVDDDPAHHTFSAFSSSMVTTSSVLP